MNLSHNDYLRIMLAIGMPMSSIGTDYVIECLERIQKHEYRTFNELYKEVAKDKSTTHVNVEKCMSKAFMTCRDKPTDFDTVDKYLGYARTGTGETLVHLFVQIKLQNEAK